MPEEKSAESPTNNESPTQANVKIIVKQPKVKKVEMEKKPRTEAQLKAMEKMREGLEKKRQARNDVKKAALDAEKKEREDAVKRAEEEAKKLSRRRGKEAVPSCRSPEDTRTKAWNKKSAQTSTGDP